MASQRRPLQSLNPNILSRRELTPYKRGKIEGARTIGGSWRQITEALHIPLRTVRNTISQASTRYEGATQPRIGRPNIYDPRDERLILRIVRQNPKITYRQLAQESGLKFCRSTFTRLLKKYGIKNWVAKKRPLLTPENASTRYRWADDRKDWTTDLWSLVIFSDECSLERGAGKRPT